MNSGATLGKEEGMRNSPGVKKLSPRLVSEVAEGSKPWCKSRQSHLSACTLGAPPLRFPTQALRMGGRVVDRARLESVFTFIGNEGSNPSPSAASLGSIIPELGESRTLVRAPCREAAIFFATPNCGTSANAEEIPPIGWKIAYTFSQS